MTESKICTCPSGDGSLRWPCPKHPAVEQAGGERRDALQSIMEWTAAENIPDERKLCLIRNAARAALAQPSPVRSSLLINGYQLRAALDFIAPDGTAEQLESEACIEWRQQDADFLEAGLYAFCAEYPEEGGVLLDEEPTNSQPSPAQELAERGTQHRFSTTEQTCRHDFAGVWWNDNGETKTGKECRECGFFIADIAEAPELERPEVVGYRIMRAQADKIYQRVDKAAAEYEAGRSALGYMEDIAEAALCLRNRLDDLLAAAPAQAQHSVPGIAESVSECMALAQTVFARMEGLMPRGKKLPEKHVARRLLAELETLAKLAAAPAPGGE